MKANAAKKYKISFFQRHLSVFNKKQRELLQRKTIFVIQIYQVN